MNIEVLFLSSTCNHEARIKAGMESGLEICKPEGANQKPEELPGRCVGQLQPGARPRLDCDWLVYSGAGQASQKRISPPLLKPPAARVAKPGSSPRAHDDTAKKTHNPTTPLLAHPHVHRTIEDNKVGEGFQ